MAPRVRDNPPAMSSAAATAAPEILHCPSCGSPVDEGTAVCTSCGTALTTPAPAEPGPSILTAGFSCQSCGATVVCEPGSRSYICAFCGSTYVVEVSGEGLAAQLPEFVIPFRIGREEATGVFDGWCRRGFFTPQDVRKAARMDKLQGLYLPFWTFSMRADSTWEADIGEWWYSESSETYTDSQGKTRSRSVRVRHTEWHPLSGRHHSWHSQYLVSGSRGLPHDEALAVCERAFREAEGERIRAFLPGDTQSGLEWTTRFSQISDDLLLLPFWIGAYTYRGKLYRYVLNGQTGRATGTRPQSPVKIAIVVVAALLLILNIVLFILHQ